MQNFFLLGIVFALYSECFAKFDDIPSVTLQDIKETKRYRHTFVCFFVRSDNMKTVYSPTNTVYGGYKMSVSGNRTCKLPNTSLDLLPTMQTGLVLLYNTYIAKDLSFLYEGSLDSNHSGQNPKLI